MALATDLLRDGVFGALLAAPQCERAA